MGTWLRNWRESLRKPRRLDWQTSIQFWNEINQSTIGLIPENGKLEELPEDSPLKKEMKLFQENKAEEKDQLQVPGGSERSSQPSEAGSSLPSEPEEV